jgi:hypothetical protein
MRSSRADTQASLVEADVRTRPFLGPNYRGSLTIYRGVQFSSIPTYSGRPGHGHDALGNGHTGGEIAGWIRHNWNATAARVTRGEVTPGTLATHRNGRLAGTANPKNLRESGLLRVALTGGNGNRGKDAADRHNDACHVVANWPAGPLAIRIGQATSRFSMTPRFLAMDWYRPGSLQWVPFDTHNNHIRPGSL